MCIRVVALFIACALCALGANLRSDITYAQRGEENLTLDASVPDGPGPFPTVIIVHGGGFVRGTKTSYVTPLFRVLTDAGFTWFTINYRLAPKDRFPAPVQDVEDAVRWVKAHAAEYKVDTRRLALVGESAGGHLVAYVGAVSGRELGLRAVVPFYAPCDFLGRAQRQGRVNENLTAFLGVGPDLTPAALELLRKASPYYQARRGMPPYLLIHGTADQLVDYSQSINMQKRLRDMGVSCDLYTVNGGGHGMGSWDKIPNGDAYKQYLVDWLKRKLR